MFFWNSLAFSLIQQMLAIWSLGLLPFLNPTWTSVKFSVHVLLKPHLENFEHYFASVWDEYNCVVVWTFFGIAFLWDWNENWPFVWLCVTPWIVASTLLCPWDLPGQNSGVGSYSLLQGIFPTQESNPRLPHFRQILSQLSYQGYTLLYRK